MNFDADLFVDPILGLFATQKKEKKRKKGTQKRNGRKTEKPEEPEQRGRKLKEEEEKIQNSKQEGIINTPVTIPALPPVRQAPCNHPRYHPSGVIDNRGNQSGKQLARGATGCSPPCCRNQSAGDEGYSWPKENQKRRGKAEKVEITEG